MPSYERDYAAERERADELAHERGFESAYFQREWVAYERDIHDDMDLSFSQALELAQFERDYDPGDMSRDELADWWEEHFDDINWDDPEDPFFDFLDALSGEGS